MRKQEEELEQCSRCGGWFKILHEVMGFRVCWNCSDKVKKELG